MRNRAIVFGVCSSLLTGTGCSGYRVTLNEQPLYEPAALFSDYTIPDAALRRCVEQTILDKGITEAEQLTAISCSYAGIETLVGLERFTQLRQLDLSHNELRSTETLLRFTKLQMLDLSGNENIPCADLQPFTVLLREEDLVVPEHCR